MEYVQGVFVSSNHKVFSLCPKATHEEAYLEFVYKNVEFGLKIYLAC